MSRPEERAAGLEAELLRSGAFRELDEPVIVTSGECLTPFYVNAEKLCGAGIEEALEESGGDDGGLISHAVGLALREAGFRDTVGVVAELVSRSEPEAISGGQRRDWLFSGPVARRLGLPHVSLYKQSPGQREERDRVVLRRADGSAAGAESIRGLRVVHVVDMVTAASSCISRDPVNGRETGWIPMLRSRGAEVSDLVAVVSRRQGGEEALGRAGVRVRSCVDVDERFLRRHSRDPEGSCRYYRNPTEWTRAYLRERGAGLIFPYLTEDPKKLPRLLKFLGCYGGFLRSQGMWDELDRAAVSQLGKTLAELQSA